MKQCVIKPAQWLLYAVTGQEVTEPHFIFFLFGEHSFIHPVKISSWRLIDGERVSHRLNAHSFPVLLLYISYLTYFSVFPAQALINRALICDLNTFYVGQETDPANLLACLSIFINTSRLLVHRQHLLTPQESLDVIRLFTSISFPGNAGKTKK